MDFIPRTKQKVTRSVTVEKQQISIQIDVDTIIGLIREEYSKKKIGPEGYIIPKDAKYEICSYMKGDDFDGIEISWNEDE